MIRCASAAIAADGRSLFAILSAARVAKGRQMACHCGMRRIITEASLQGAPTPHRRRGPGAECAANGNSAISKRWGEKKRAALTVQPVAAIRRLIVKNATRKHGRLKTTLNCNRLDEFGILRQLRQSFAVERRILIAA
jgi:hypothetical protein